MVPVLHATDHKLQKHRLLRQACGAWQGSEMKNQPRDALCTYLHHKYARLVVYFLLSMVLPSISLMKHFVFWKSVTTRFRSAESSTHSMPYGLCTMRRKASLLARLGSKLFLSKDARPAYSVVLQP